MEYQITKRFSKKVTLADGEGYKSYEFSTQLSKTVDIDSAEKLQSESDKLFAQAKTLTNDDISSTLGENYVTN